ncbi:hypothetical protein SAMN02745866_00031 [Alteromonadaceae bacterium Bs31]|nr:hypothetical protein SAMN02745866_00031 [Alteromonadaceae bacterium Bs31]
MVKNREKTPQKTTWQRYRTRIYIVVFAFCSVKPIHLVLDTALKTVTEKMVSHTLEASEDYQPPSCFVINNYYYSSSHQCQDQDINLATTSPN